MSEIVDSNAQLRERISEIPVIANYDEDDSAHSDCEVGTMEVFEAPPPQIAKDEEGSTGEGKKR